MKELDQQSRGKRIFYLISYALMYPFIWLISHLPFKVNYAISDFLSFILYHVIGYRKKIIHRNIKRAFPEKKDQEISTIARDSLRHLCDVYIELLKFKSVDNQTLLERVNFIKPEIVEQSLIEGKPVILMLGHQANYEWLVMINHVISYPIYTLYKPIRNRKINDLILNMREKSGCHLHSTKNSSNIIKQFIRDKQTIFAAIADQSPQVKQAIHFTSFFNTVTGTFKGAEEIARKFDAAVFFLDMKKTSRGNYSVEFKKITNNAGATDNWEITDTFYQLLENQIKQQPEYYMWSHKRWKSTPDNATRAVELSPRVPQ